MPRTTAGRSRQLGLLLKQWRRRRAVSQLALALEAGVSPRHLSFVETGRTRASREFLLRLADALRIPLRERNVLLAAGGFGPLYPQSDLAGEQLAPVRQALARLLEHQEPYPAVLLDRQWNVLQTNRAAPKLFSLFIDLQALPPPPSRNLLRTMFDPQGMKPWIENWDDVAHTLVQRVFLEAVAGVPDERTLSLLGELRVRSPESYDAGLAVESPLPFHPVVFRKAELRLSFFSMVTTVGAPLDITAQELRIEAFFPADVVTEEFARRELASR